MSLLPDQRPAGTPFHVKRGIAYGAAVGLLVGLIYRGFVEVSPISSVVIWRNFVLGGMGVGAVIGLVVVLAKRKVWKNG